MKQRNVGAEKLSSGSQTSCQEKKQAQIFFPDEIHTPSWSILAELLWYWKAEIQRSSWRYSYCFVCWRKRWDHLTVPRKVKKTHNISAKTKTVLLKTGLQEHIIFPATTLREFYLSNLSSFVLRVEVISQTKIMLFNWWFRTKHSLPINGLYDEANITWFGGYLTIGARDAEDSVTVQDEESEMVK